MKKYIIVGIISSLLLLSSVAIILSCAGEEAAAYIGTWVYVDEVEGEMYKVDIKETSFECMMYIPMEGPSAKGEKQLWMPYMGFRGSFSVSNGVFSISLTEGYDLLNYGEDWFDNSSEYWEEYLLMIALIFDTELSEDTFELGYSVSGNELTLILAGAEGTEEIIFTKQ
jgi:hypothetical protein